MCKQYDNDCLQVFLGLILRIAKKMERRKWTLWVAPSLCFTSTHLLCKHQSLKLVSKLRTQFPRGSKFGRRRFPLSWNTPFPVHSAETQMGVFLKPNKQPQFLCCYLKFELRSVALEKALVIWHEQGSLPMLYLENNTPLLLCFPHLVLSLMTSHTVL